MSPMAIRPFSRPCPVRGRFLTVSPRDGTVSVATLAGSVVAFRPENGSQFRYKYSLPAIKPQPPAPAGSLGASGVTLHTATDPQGDLYVSDAVSKTVTKYLPNGAPLGLVAHSSLNNPQAVGAASDGTVYLIDAEQLKVFRAHPSTTPLPPIPKPAPKPVAPVPALAPAAPVPAPNRFQSGYFSGTHHYGHYGYHHFRHYGGGQR